ncbi:hypothetical protein STANM309S_06112 [Streptomyces tanashiensis]
MHTPSGTSLPVVPAALAPVLPSRYGLDHEPAPGAGIRVTADTLPGLESVSPADENSVWLHDALLGPHSADIVRYLSLARSTGGPVRAMYSRRVGTVPEMTQHLEDRAALGVELRLSPVVPMNMVLADENFALLPTDPHDPDSPTILARGPGLVRSVPRAVRVLLAGGRPVRRGARGARRRRPLRPAAGRAAHARLRHQGRADSRAASGSRCGPSAACCPRSCRSWVRPAASRPASRRPGSGCSTARGRNPWPSTRSSDVMEDAHGPQGPCGPQRAHDGLPPNRMTG